MKIQSKDFPLYGGKLVFIESENTPELRKLLPGLEEGEDLFGQTFEHEYKDHRAVFIVFNSKRNCPEMCDKITHGNVAHEAFHAVHYLLDTVGMKLTDESQEAYAYLLDWVVEEFYLWANKINLKIV